MTIKEILQKSVKILATKKISSANLDAEILLLHALAQSKNKPKLFNNDRSWLYAHDDYELNKKQENKFCGLIERRKHFEPVAYITGKKEFYGLDFYVNKNVLIPRPETEIMVKESLKEILSAIRKNPKKKLNIADIGTGSGAIAISIAKTLKGQKCIRQVNPIRELGSLMVCASDGIIPPSAFPNGVKIFAADISAKALKIAKINAKTRKCDKNIIFKKGDLLKALPKNTKIDFLLANLPYVGNDYYYYKWLKNGSALSGFHEIKHEPKSSLLAGINGLKYFKEFFQQLPEYLQKNTKIFLESDPHQISAIKKLAKKYLPAHKIEIFKDSRGLNRITKIEINPIIG